MEKDAKMVDVDEDVPIDTLDRLKAKAGRIAQASTSTSSSSSRSIFAESEIPKGILPYLIKLDHVRVGGNLLQALYRDTFTALTVFRSMPALAQQYVLRLLALPDQRGLERSTIDAWVVPTSRSHHLAAIHKLKEVKIIQEREVTGGHIVYLDSQFKKSVRAAICDSIYQGSDIVINTDEKAPSANDLDVFAQKKWEEIFYYIVDRDGELRKYFKTTHETPRQEVINLLYDINLLDRKNETLTNDGFQFLFQPLHGQIWKIMMGYMEGLQKRNMDRNEVLTFLFRLSFLEFGQGYPATHLYTQTQQMLVYDLSLLGLIYQRKRSSERYYPTRLAINLSSGTNLTKKEMDDQGYIIVENTFKVYAYTSNQLQIALLRLIVRIDVILPNLVTGMITKDSILNAIKKGVRAHQIISFLEQYAHPRMRDSDPVLPRNVTDLVLLWEQERDRLKFEQACFLYNFVTVQEFYETLEFAKGNQILLWSDSKKQWMVITAAGKKLIKTWRDKRRET